MKLQEFVDNFKELCFDNSDSLQEESFVSTFCDYLIDMDIIEGYELSYGGKAQQGFKINAYHSNEDENKLIVIIADFESFEFGSTISKTSIQKAYNRAVKYMNKSVDGLVKHLEDTAEDYPFAQLVYNKHKNFKEIEVFILTNKIYKSNEKIDHNTIEGKIISYQIWDLERLYQMVNETQGIENVEIRFEDYTDIPITMIKVNNSSEDYDCYIGYITGEVLATIYEQWGQRLIERNVRSFLQARGNVNKGIKNTLKNESEMFVAYNNGISTVAEEIVLDHLPDTPIYTLKSIKGWQIVNGGQTTASMYYTKKDEKITLEKANVQMKLTVINTPEKMNEMTSKISEYANTQNKISLSDLKANHHSLVALESFSRSIWVPSIDGVKSNSKWFFERANGQYLVDLSRKKTTTQKNQFKFENPKEQLLSKTDIAKAFMSWFQAPHKVSKGAESNFKDFMEYLDTNSIEINADFFKKLIATVILFKTCDKLVKKNGYPGYKANIVTYTIAALSKLEEGNVDLFEIWNSQKLSENLIKELGFIIEHTWNHINSPPIEGSNISSWCKKEECWTSYKQKLENFNLIRI